MGAVINDPEVWDLPFTCWFLRFILSSDARRLQSLKVVHHDHGLILPQFDRDQLRLRLPHARARPVSYLTLTGPAHGTLLFANVHAAWTLSAPALEDNDDGIRDREVLSAATLEDSHPLAVIVRLRGLREDRKDPHLATNHFGGSTTHNMG